jgi:outer membrane protein OmpU
MGDSGKLTFGGNSVTGDGIHSVNNIVPHAADPVYSMTDTATAYGVADGADAASNLGYNITVGDLKVSAEMQKGAGTSRGYGLTYTGIENLTIALGTGEVSPGQVSGGNDERVWGLKYAVAGATLAYMQTEIDTGGGADEDATHMGVSFAVNDDLTISYAVQDVNIGGKSADEKNSGIGVSYTMGSMSVKAYAGKSTDGNGVATADDEGKGITFSIAF